jgi:hypothetical protein
MIMSRTSAMVAFLTEIVKGPERLISLLLYKKRAEVSFMIALSASSRLASLSSRSSLRSSGGSCAERILVAPKSIRIVSRSLKIGFISVVVI